MSRADYFKKHRPRILREMGVRLLKATLGFYMAVAFSMLLAKPVLQITAKHVEDQLITFSDAPPHRCGGSYVPSNAPGADR